MASHKRKKHSDDPKTVKEVHHKKTVKEIEAEHEEHLIEEGLEAIYGKDTTDFSQVDRGNSRLTNILLTVIVVLTVIAVTAWSGFFVYNKYFAQDEAATFELEINVDEEVASGEETTIEILYSNPTTVPIAALDIEAHLPSSFQVNSLSPVPGNSEEFKWDIGYLPPGADGEILIEGLWLSEVPSSTPIQVFANFRPANFNADFQDIATAYISSLSSTLELSIEGNEEATTGKDLEYIIKLKNTGEEIIEPIEVRLELPDGFYLESSNPEIEAGSGTVWLLNGIGEEETTEITFAGTFASDSEGFQYFELEAGILNNDMFLSQTTVQGFTDAVGTDLALGLVVNGTTDEVSADLGDDVRISISFENSGEEDIEEMDLLLDFQAEDSMPIQWDEAGLDGGKLTTEGVLWEAEELEIIASGEKRVLNLTFPINDAIEEGESDSFTILVRATLDDSEVRSSPVIISVNTEAGFITTIRYYNEEGAPLGTGPIPPEVDETTVYRVYWEIENTLHELEDIQISAALPPHVEWLGQSSADLGSISYSDSDATVVWTITSLPTSITTLGANFAISLTPDEDDLGTFVKLISGSTFQATDSSTSSLIQRSTESLTTDLTEDDYAADKGAVIN